MGTDLVLQNDGLVGKGSKMIGVVEEDEGGCSHFVLNIFVSFEVSTTSGFVYYCCNKTLYLDCICIDIISAGDKYDLWDKMFSFFLQDPQFDL